MRRFHGIACYVRNSVHEHILRIPEEDEELEIVHLLLKYTIPNINIIGAYLDCEKDIIKTKRIWSKLTGRIEIALGRGEEVILMGDLNRPLQSSIPTFGTKILLDWEKTGQVKILNNKTRTHMNRPMHKERVNIRRTGNINKPKTKCHWV